MRMMLIFQKNTDVRGVGCVWKLRKGVVKNGQKFADVWMAPWLLGISELQ